MTLHTLQSPPNRLTLHKDWLAVLQAREQATVSLLCNTYPDCFDPINRIGGLSTGGLGMTDSCWQSDQQQVDPANRCVTRFTQKERVVWL